MKVRSKSNYNNIAEELKIKNCEAYMDWAAAIVMTVFSVGGWEVTDARHGQDGGLAGGQGGLPGQGVG